MKYLLKVVCLLVMSYRIYSQDTLVAIHHPSKYYKEMFPPHIDEVKLLVLLPTKLSKAKVDTMLKHEHDADLSKVYEYHEYSTEETSIEVQKYVKMYGINAEVITKDKYNLLEYPASTYPLVVYPDSMLVDRYYVTFGYHLHDATYKVNYGYAIGGNASRHDKYFKQLATYIAKLKQSKQMQAPSTDAPRKAEDEIYKSQKRKRVMTHFVALPVIFVGATLLTVWVITKL